MFILEREEQLQELLRVWACRYKNRRLSKVPLPHSPELFDLLLSLRRFSGPSIQEVWGITYVAGQAFLWLEEPPPGKKEFSPFISGTPDVRADKQSFWDWSGPCLLENETWVYPLKLFAQPPSEIAKPTATCFPKRQFCYYRDLAGFWKYGDQLLSRIDTPISLLIKSEHPAIKVFVRKLLISLFNWKHTLLMDLGENPMSLLGNDDIPAQNIMTFSATHSQDMINGICNKIPSRFDSRSVVILCNNINSAFEAALIQQLLQKLADRSPLFICLEASDHFSFSWTLNEEIQDNSSLSPPQEEHGKGERPILRKIGRILEVIPDRLSLDHINRWFENKETQRLHTCLDHGYLMEKSGQIIIPDQLFKPTSGSIPNEDEKKILSRALDLYQSALTALKLHLLERDLNALKSGCTSVSFLLQLHQHPRLLLKILDQTEPHWIKDPNIVLFMAELTLSLFLLPLSHSLLEKCISNSKENEKKCHHLKTILNQVLNYSCHELMSMALNNADIASLAKSESRSIQLKNSGYLSLSIIAETEALMADALDNEVETHFNKLNELLFRSKCLDNPDLTIWVNLAWSHWHMRYGSPIIANSLLQNCYHLSKESLFSPHPSLILNEMLLGHWKHLPQLWPPILPGGFLPPDKNSWDYLHLLLQHRFTEAIKKYREFSHFPQNANQNTKWSCAGLCFEMMTILHNQLFSSDPKDTEIKQSLPPWLEFIRCALKPFCHPSSIMGSTSMPHFPAYLHTKERNYYYYEYHYLRFHINHDLQILKAEERDIFLDTCAYFTRRGRQLSQNIHKLRSKLAETALSENRASDTILITAAKNWHTPQDHLKAVLGIVITHFSPEFCFIRLLNHEKPIHTEGSPNSFEPLADWLFLLAPNNLEEKLDIEKIKNQCPGPMAPYLLPLNSLRLLRFFPTDTQISMIILLGFKNDPEPNVPLFDRIQRVLSPIISQIQSNFNTYALAETNPLNSIIGESILISELKKQIQRVSQVDFTVTILGESGTGKELIAKAIHQLSPRNSKPFIAFNCASLPEPLLEAELFGYQKGAFTDARENRIGLIESAESGTLFLDEIGEMSLLLQAKLLRFLQDHSIRHLGENKQRQVNCRILCATHRDLLSMVNKKKFREDLYYRIQELTLFSPPLRDRKEDIPLLLDHFCNKYQFQKLTQIQKHWLALKWMNQDWPGNIRELESRIKELITYYPHHPDIEGPTPLLPITQGTLHNSRNQFERICVHSALEKNCWNRKRSAAYLGVSRITLFKLMQKYQLRDPNTD